MSALAQPMPSLPCIVLFGLSGAGKTSIAQLIESAAIGERVRRYTTRMLRPDDDARLVIHMKSVEGSPSDVLYEGWGDTLYCVKGEDVAAVRQRDLMPVIEVGEYRHAKMMLSAFGPGYLVLVDRALDSHQMRAALIERGMTQMDLELRMASLEEDRQALSEVEDSQVIRLRNASTLRELRAAVEQMLATVCR